jgi:DNA mismatch repair protein MutL
MGLIKVLPNTLISQIAAGEVIERPASVVKELIENSLDAGATAITVEAEQGGARLISVRDNGCGMDQQDAKMSFVRHATSKISSQEDLMNIKSFGFRGEALAAIASVAFVTLRTRREEDSAGFEISYKGGEQEYEKPVGCPPGTEVIVRSLFFNLPARRKFLKSETTELSNIAAVVSHMAIANPGVAFLFKHNGKTIIDVPAVNLENFAIAQKLRMAEVLGKSLLEDLLLVDFKTPSIHIHGFVGRPGIGISSRRHQYLFVNRRDVTDPMIHRAVFDAYASRLPGRMFPVFILHVDIDPHEVDINVHPRKLAVKFVDTQRVFRDVRQAVSQALSNFEKGMFYAVPNVNEKPNEELIQKAMEFGERERVPSVLRVPSVQSAQKPHILGQIANSYILVFAEEGLAIVDQHAAHERILYEKFKNKASDESKSQSQQLLTPITLECSRDEAVFLKDALAHLTAIGFEFDEWSGNTFVIRSCPASLKSENLEKVFREFLDGLINEKENSKILPEKILKMMACKAAVKFGMQLSVQEQEELLTELQKTPNSSTCPHGRPTRVLLTFSELETRFYRRK